MKSSSKSEDAVSTRPPVSFAEIARSLIISAILVAGSTVLLASRLDERVKANRELAERDASAICKIQDEKNANAQREREDIKTVLKDIMPVLRALSEGQGKTDKQLVRLDEKVTQLTRSVDKLSEHSDR